MPKQIKRSTLINIILGTALVGVVVFGYFAFNKLNPKDVMVANMPALQPVPPRAEYLYSIYGSSDKLFKEPQSATVFKNKIYVADSGNSRVVVFDYNGKHLLNIGEKGKGRLKQPHKVYIKNDVVYVTDIDTRLIHKFDLEGKFLGYFAEKIGARPIDLIIQQDRSLLLDNLAMKLNVMSADGKKWIKSIGQKGQEKGQFYYPYSFGIDKDNNLYVTDSNNNRIQKLSPKLKLAEVWGGKEDENVSMITPRGIAFDSKGYLYCANPLDNTVKIHDPKQKGKVVSIVSKGETKDESLLYPNEVWVDDNDRLYVTDKGRNRIVVYSVRH